MPIVTGPIQRGGAVVDVPGRRAQLLRQSGLPVPPPVHVRVLIDTGAHMTGLAPRVFEELGLVPVARVPILTPSTLPHSPFECDQFHVAMSLVANGSAHPFGDRRVLGADCWMDGEGIEGLIGRDILDRCNLWYLGQEQQFSLGF